MYMKQKYYMWHPVHVSYISVPKPPFTSAKMELNKNPMQETVVVKFQVQVLYKSYRPLLRLTDLRFRNPTAAVVSEHIYTCALKRLAICARFLWMVMDVGMVLFTLMLEAVVLMTLCPMLQLIPT